MFFLLRLAVIIQATWLSPLSTAESIAQVDKDSITFSSNQAETTVDIIKKLTTQCQFFYPYFLLVFNTIDIALANVFR